MQKKITEMNYNVGDVARAMPGYEELPDASEYGQAAKAISMDPLIRQTFYERSEIDVNPLSGDSASFVLFLRPETYWKLFIVVPSDYEHQVASKVTRLFYVLWIVGIIVVLFAVSFLLKRVLLQPLQALDYRLEVIDGAIEKANWVSVKKMVSYDTSQNEIGKIHERVGVLLQRFIDVYQGQKKGTKPKRR